MLDRTLSRARPLAAELFRPSRACNVGRVAFKRDTGSGLASWGRSARGRSSWRSPRSVARARRPGGARRAERARPRRSCARRRRGPRCVVVRRAGARASSAAGPRCFSSSWCASTLSAWLRGPCSEVPCLRPDPVRRSPWWSSSCRPRASSWAPAPGFVRSHVAEARRVTVRGGLPSSEPGEQTSTLRSSSLTFVRMVRWSFSDGGAALIKGERRRPKTGGVSVYRMDAAAAPTRPRSIRPPRSLRSPAAAGTSNNGSRADLGAHQESPLWCG